MILTFPFYRCTGVEENVFFSSEKSRREIRGKGEREREIGEKKYAVISITSIQDCYEFSLNPVGERFRYNNASHVCLTRIKWRKNDNVTCDEISNPGFFRRKIIQILVKKNAFLSFFIGRFQQSNLSKRSAELSHLLSMHITKIAVEMMPPLYKKHKAASTMWHNVSLIQTISSRIFINFSFNALCARASLFSRKCDTVCYNNINYACITAYGYVIFASSFT